MKFNISFPLTGQQKTFEVDDEKKVAKLYEKRMGQEFDGEILGEQWKGYIFRISGGNDQDGFSMKQGVPVAGRVRLLLRSDATCYRARRTGERKRKSIRGCIVGPDLAVIALTIEKKGEQEVPGLTDVDKPRRLGPKRAAHIRKIFDLQKGKDDVRKYVVRREIIKGDKTFYKSPRIQRLITDKRLRRKKLNKKIKKERYNASKEQRQKYEKVLSKFLKERKAKRDEQKKEKAQQAAS